MPNPSLSQPARSRQAVLAGRVLQLLGASLLGQAITIVVAPILTRLYTPEQYGVLGSFTAIVTILSSLSTMRYELGFTNVRDEAEARTLYVLCGLILLGACFACVPLAYAAAVLPAHSPDWLRACWWTVPLGMTLIGAYCVVVAEATRRHLFRAIAESKISQGFVSAATQVGFGVLSFGTTGLMVGFLLGQLSGVYTLVRKLPFAQEPWPSGERLRQTSRHYRPLALYSSWAGVLDAAGSGYLLTLLVGWLYPPQYVGYLFLADRVIGRPLLMVANSILPVYLGEFSRLRRTDATELARISTSALRKQLLFGSIWVGLVIVSARYVVVPLFGPNWQEAVTIIQLVAIATLPQAVMQPIIHTLPMLGRHRYAAIWSAARLLALTVGILLPFWFGLGVYAAIAVYAVVQLVAYTSLFVETRRAINQMRTEPE